MRLRPQNGAPSRQSGLATLLAGGLLAAGGVCVGAARAEPVFTDLSALPSSKSAQTSDGIVGLAPARSSRVLIPAGAFLMGSEELEIVEAVTTCQAEQLYPDQVCKNDRFAHEWPAHDVYLSAFWLDRHEVTVASFDRCVRAGKCTRPPYASGGTRFDKPDYPVTLVTHKDAQSYCAFAGGALPTEAQWERAARGPARRTYAWGAVFNPFNLNHGSTNFRRPHDDTDGFVELAPVGSFPAGQTPDGIMDLGGNVEEWIADWYAPQYPEADEADPVGPSQGDYRVVRGGAYVWGGSASLRAAMRTLALPSDRASYRGFRCAYPVGGR